MDVTNQFDSDFFPPGQVPFADLIDGERDANRLQAFQYTADIGATATANLGSRVTSTSSVGLQYFQNITTGLFVNGNRLPAGTNSLNGAVNTQVIELTNENITAGIFGEQQFALNDRLFIAGGLRIDDNSAFGVSTKRAVYPKVAGSWVISEEPFFPAAPSFLTSLRLRAAWGETGVQPTGRAALRFFTPVAVTFQGNDVVGIADSSLGNADLRPETSEEYELGFDLELFRGRIGLQGTYYHKTTSDAIVERVTAPSIGAGDGQFINISSVLNKGFEATLSVDVFQSPVARWNITARGATVSNTVLKLGEGIEPIIFGAGLNTQRHQEGFPAGAYFQNPILGFEDANGDGIISSDEVEVGDEPEFIGWPIPKRELSIQTSFTLFNRIRLTGLLNHRGGHHLLNSTEEFRCAQFFLCEEANVVDSDLEKQAATVAQITHPSGTVAGFIEDASFWKLREASATFLAPTSWARKIGAERWSLTLSVRNLFTITDYSGVDPEATQLQNANFLTSDFLTQPPVRYWTARVNVSF